MKDLKNKTSNLRYLIWLCLLIAVAYGAGRVYFNVTGGFLESNITSDLSYDERWLVSPLSPEKQKVVEESLAQNYHYLGKGCQSYVFMSDDGQYVIKFFKYQRFRPQEWLNYISFIPSVEEYRQGKILQKRQKLDNIFTSWKIAYENLQAETGLIYVHLNKSKDLNKVLTIYDKIGLKHELNLDHYEFLIQRSAGMLTPTLADFMKKGEVQQAKDLISSLINMIVSEYQRGIGDNDHALMQNTGVIDGAPVHIDVGQFVQKEAFKDPVVYKQELFNKTYKFRIWLKKHYPVLEKHVEELLLAIIGPEIKTLKPHLKNMGVEEL